MQTETLAVDEYSETRKFIRAVELIFTTWRVGDRYTCTVRNADPGATICRVSDASLDGALRHATDHASRNLDRTSTYSVPPPRVDSSIDRIILAEGNGERDYPLTEFLQAPVRERMEKVLTGQVKFLNGAGAILSTGEAVRALSLVAR
jgi:hypothetical protein